MPSRTAARPAPAPTKAPPAASRWIRQALVALAAIYCFSLFSGEAGDSDMWWHLEAGRYIWQHHRLPVPDPFAYTTDSGKPQYLGELTTRHFNLTHEWGMELIDYLIQSSTGFAGLVLFRTLLLTLFCAMTGWLAWRRSGSFSRGLVAGLAASLLAANFAADRAYLATFVLVTLTVAAFETRRGLWLMPLVFLVWSNCHGGFLMGWAVAGAYSAEALLLRYGRKPLADERKIWIVTVLSIVASLCNPNGANAIAVMWHYRDSPMQISIYEWNYPAWWPPDYFNMLMIGTASVQVWARRRVRPRDWLLFASLAGASAMALRNIIFIGFIGPVLLATYLPQWKRRVPQIAQYLAAALLILGVLHNISFRGAFQLHAADWAYPGEAADFLIAHHVTGPMFNTYEQGGYLMWRLWPQERVFIDGRALNERVWDDYMHMAFNADYQGGKTTAQLLQQYGVQVIVMPGFDFKGHVFFLAAALADPAQNDWKLVYQDNKVVIYMRQPPPGVQPLPSLDALGSLEQQCNFNTAHGRDMVCAQSLGEMFERIGDWKRARAWLMNYLAVDPQDPKSRNLLRQLDAAGR